MKFQPAEKKKKKKKEKKTRLGRGGVIVCYYPVVEPFI